MALMTLTQFLLLAEPGLSNIWHEAEEPVDLQYPKLLNVGNLELATEADAKMAGFGGLLTQAEGETVYYDTALSPVQVFYTEVVRALGYQVTDKLIRWEQYGQVELFERDLMRAAVDDQEVFAFGLINNGTGTTVSAGFDGLALWSTAHTRLDGGTTQSNRLATLGALSVANFQTALIQFRKWLNDRGRPIRSKPKTLLIPPDLEPTAIEILQSTDRPDTANRTTNAITRWGIQPLVSEYLTSTTHWSLWGDKHDVNFKWSFRPETGSETDFDTDVIKHKVRQGFARGHGHWVGTMLGNT